MEASSTPPTPSWSYGVSPERGPHPSPPVTRNRQQLPSWCPPPASRKHPAGNSYHPGVTAPPGPPVTRNRQQLPSWCHHPHPSPPATPNRQQLPSWYHPPPGQPETRSRQQLPSRCHHPSPPVTRSRQQLPSWCPHPPVTAPPERPPARGNLATPGTEASRLGRRAGETNRRGCHFAKKN